MRFLSSWGNSFGQSRLEEEKKRKATPLSIGGLESSSSPLVYWLFLQKKIRGLARSKKSKKNECVVVSSFV